MATATLIGGWGTTRVNRGSIFDLPPPAPLGPRHVPIAHGDVVAMTEDTLRDAGYAITKSEFAIGQDFNRLFATFVLESTIAGVAALAVGLRSSHNRTLPLGLVAGTQVFVCSNLAFRSDLINVRRLHTKNGSKFFTEDIARAIATLPDFQATETARVEALMATKLSDDQAEALILRAALDAEILPLRLLPKTLHEYREPTHACFAERNAWSLFNAVTTVLGDYANPHDHCRRTMKLNKLILPNLCVTKG